MLILKRIEKFCSSHRLFNPLWTDEENWKIFGKCSNKNGHGHNYTLEVCLSGEINSETSMIFNIQSLKEILMAQIINDVDHQNLNCDVPWLENKNPTTEIFVEAIFNRLQNYFVSIGHSSLLYSVTLWETDKNSVTKMRDC